MKSFFKVLVLLIILLAKEGHAQDNTIKAYYDEKGVISVKDKAIKKDQSFKIDVHDVNTILHKVGFKFKDYELFSKAPSTITNLFTNIPDNAMNIFADGWNENEAIEILDKISFFAKHSVELDEYKKRIAKVKDNKDLISAECQKISGEWSKLLNDALELESTVDSNNFVSITNAQITMAMRYYEIMEIQANNATQSNHELAKLLATYQQSYLELKKAQSKIISGLSAVKEGRLLKNIKFEASSTTHFPKKDLTEGIIYIVNRFNLKDTVVQKKMDIFIKNKTKIDFSTGFAGNTLVQKDFFFTKTDATNTGIDNEESAAWDLGVAAFLHVDWRILSNLSVGPQAGLAVSLFDTQPRYMLGIGSSVGRDKSITVSAGVNLAQLKVLSKQVSTDGKDYDGSSDLAQFEAVPLTPKLKTGFYLALTYNLTRTRK